MTRQSLPLHSSTWLSNSGFLFSLWCGSIFNRESFVMPVEKLSIDYLNFYELSKPLLIQEESWESFCAISRIDIAMSCLQLLALCCFTMSQQLSELGIEFKSQSCMFYFCQYFVKHHIACFGSVWISQDSLLYHPDVNLKLYVWAEKPGPESRIRTLSLLLI